MRESRRLSGWKDEHRVVLRRGDTFIRSLAAEEPPAAAYLFQECAPLYGIGALDLAQLNPPRALDGQSTISTTEVV